MIGRLLILFALVVGSLAVTAAPSFAECSLVQEEQMVEAKVKIVMVERCPPDEEANSSVDDSREPPRDSDWDAACVRMALAVDLDPAAFCDIPPAAVLPEITPGLVNRALARIPLPEANLVIQPPNGRTLVNFDTNFYTEQGEFTRTVTLLGRQVDLRIWPESFRWRFGDGEMLESSSPGSPYPDLEITHSYPNKGRVSPSLDVTYAAQYRVEGGPWQGVPGTVTIQGSPQSLRIVTARPVLVGG